MGSPASNYRLRIHKSNPDPSYRRREPETTLLHQIVRTRLEEFPDRARYAREGTFVRYRIESPVAFARSLPFVALFPVVVSGIGGYLASTAVAPHGGIGRIAVTAVCALAGFIVAGFLAAIVVYGIRRDTDKLLAFVRETLETTGQ